jgi:hypothetical protein
MKKHFSFILLLALMLSIFSLGYAATVQVGDGTTTTSAFPITSVYGYTYSQQIYTREQINHAGDITKIRFWYVSGNLTNNRDWVIYMGHTQKTSFTSNSDWEPIVNLTQVFSGDVLSMVPAGNNWMEITLTTPFPYNNTDNLLVAVDENTQGWASMSWGGFTSGANTGLRFYSDSNNPDPANPPTTGNLSRSGTINRIQLVFPDTVPPDAPQLVAPINGAQVYNGQSLSWTLPAGSADATGYDVYIGGTRVSYDQASTSYTLSGLSTGIYHWWVVARNDIGESSYSDLETFEILDGVIIGEGTSTHRFPFNAFYGYGRSIGLYTADQIGQNGLITSLGWSVSTSGSAVVPYEIYIKPTTETAQTQMTWTDFIDGITPVKVGSYTFNSIGWHEFTLDSPYIYNGGNLLIGVKVNYGGSGAGYSDAPIFYHSTGTTASHQQWQKDSTIPDGDNGALNTNLPNLLIKVSPIPPDPVFAINPADHDFGRRQINTTTSQTFTISNNGGGTLNVSAIILDNPSEGFTAENVNIPADLSTGQTTTFDIQYAPTAAGTHSATFTIFHTNGTTDVTVSGECYDPTITSFPYLENFDGTWTGTPAAPTDWTVINANNDGYTWRQSSQYISPTHSAPYAAHGMGNTDDWLITPAINPSADIRLKWWDKVENSSKVNSYKVMISTTTPEITSFTELLDVNCNNTTWTEHELNLDNYTGQTFYLAFYQYASATTYHGFGIDDFLLEEIPTDPILTYTPASLDFAPVRVNTATEYKNVRVTNTGVGTLELYAADLSFMGAGAEMFGIDPSFQSLELTANQYGDIPVRYNPTAAGAHTAILRMTYAGNNYDVALSGRAAGENALFESFEDTPFPPTGWQTTWTRSTYQYRYGSASAYKYVSDSTQHLLITPMLAVEPGSRLYFWAYCSVTSGSLQVLQSQDRENWTQLEVITFPTASTWFEHDIDLGELNGNYYLALRNTASGSYYADMFIGPDLAAIAPDAPTLTAPADAATDVAIRPVFTWTAANTGGVPTSYNIYCDANENPTTPIGTSTTTSFTPENALPYGSTLYWTVTAVNATGESDKATPRSITTIPDPTVYAYPFFEGFEEGQTNEVQVGGGWTQLSNNKYWIANSSNTTSGRAPRNGDFNATLAWEGDVMLARPFSMQAGKTYDVEVWARQDTEVLADASIGLYYGTEGTLADITDVIADRTGVGSGEYQQISGSFTPETDGIYWIGIYGMVEWDPMYLSMDDITVKIAADVIAGNGYEVLNMNGEPFGSFFNSTHDLYEVPGFDGTTGPVAELTNLDPDNTHIAAYTAESGIFDLTFTATDVGTYYLMGFWGGEWHQANIWPLIVQVGDIGETVLFDINFAAKGDVYVVYTRGNDPTVPVELSQFAATITAENFVQITWTTQSESNISGYNIYRNDSMDLSSAIKVSDLIEGTNASEAHTYTYLDKELDQSGTYYYWLQNVELDGYTSFYGPVSVSFKVDDEGGAPPVNFVTRLENAYPNPFNPNTNIRYQLKDAGDVKIDIFNARGQLVRSFSRTHDAAGYYQINWDGRDSSGKAVSSGVYQYKMTSGKYHSTKKMVLKK